MDTAINELKVVVEEYDKTILLKKLYSDWSKFIIELD